MPDEGGGAFDWFRRLLKVAGGRKTSEPVIMLWMLEL
jgi:hypothetical protein